MLKTKDLLRQSEEDAVRAGYDYSPSKYGVLGLAILLPKDKKDFFSQYVFFRLICDG